jgi:hypothetical protein
MLKYNSIPKYSSEIIKLIDEALLLLDIEADDETDQDILSWIKKQKMVFLSAKIEIVEGMYNGIS